MQKYIWEHLSAAGYKGATVYSLSVFLFVQKWCAAVHAEVLLRTAHHVEIQTILTSKETLAAKPAAHYCVP